MRRIFQLVWAKDGYQPRSLKRDLGVRPMFGSDAEARDAAAVIARELGLLGDGDLMCWGFGHPARSHLKWGDELPDDPITCWSTLGDDGEYKFVVYDQDF